MILSNDAYNGLNKIASKTKMDCWFWLTTDDDGNDVVEDLENGVILPIEDAVIQLSEGIIEPLEKYGLSDEEIAAVTDLLQASFFKL